MGTGVVDGLVARCWQLVCLKVGNLDYLQAGLMVALWGNMMVVEMVCCFCLWIAQSNELSAGSMDANLAALMGLTTTTAVCLRGQKVVHSALQTVVWRGFAARLTAWVR